MRRQTINPAGVVRPKTVPDPGATPNVNGDHSIQVRPPRLKNTRDYGKKPVMVAPAPSPFGPGRLGGI